MKWNLKPKAPSAFLKQFPEYPSLICQLLYSRGIKSQKDIDEFFNPDYSDNIHNPFLMKDMKKAVERISKAIKEKEKIFIYGDFDADGVCSTAILYLTFKELNFSNVDIYIPDRETEGHGLNKNAVEFIKREKGHLIITVDCGCVDFEEVELANSLGIDVIITDHHLLRNKKPKTLALINPFQEKDKYPFKELAGAGVAYKLACALLRHFKNEYFEKWLLDITAIATVADMMPLIGENRALVKYGLGVLAQTKWDGLKELMKVSGISPKVVKSSRKGEVPLTNLNAHMLGFALGPRLNAAGRMDHANIAYNLLVSNRTKAKILAERINHNNSERQKLTDEIAKQVEERLRKTGIKENKFVFEGDPDWPSGLIGLIAGKITSRYNIPTVIYQEREDKICASCRSISQIDLVKIFSKCLNLFNDFGGHKQSCGFKADKSNLDKIKNVFIKEIKKQMDGVEIEEILDIDAQLELEDISWKNYDFIQDFAPFGKKNKEPRFLIKKAEIVSCRTVGNGSKHLKMELMVFGKDSNLKKINAIAFGMGDKNRALKEGSLVDVVFEMILNEWNNNRSLEMKIIDLRLS